MNKSRPQLAVDLGYPTEAQGLLPAFNSTEEEAEVWDTHDFTDLSELTEDDFDDEFGPATSPPELADELPVRLASADRDELDRRAEEMGVEPAELVRIWVAERLHKEAS
jgi:hypothetical protein